MLLQACAHEVWLTCAIWDTTLGVAHMADEELMSLAGALSHSIIKTIVVISLWIVGSLFLKVPIFTVHLITLHCSRIQYDTGAN